MAETVKDFTDKHEAAEAVEAPPAGTVVEFDVADPYGEDGDVQTRLGVVVRAEGAGVAVFDLGPARAVRTVDPAAIRGV